MPRAPLPHPDLFQRLFLHPLVRLLRHRPAPGPWLGPVLALGLALADPAAAAGRPPFETRVLRVVDGDTLQVQGPPGRAPLTLRLDGLDAPERCQAGGAQARAALRGRVEGRPVRVRLRARDDWGRWVARVSDDRGDVGAWLVAGGHAWAHRWHGRPGVYAREESRARRAARGVFADPAALSPRDFRATHGPCNGTGHRSGR